MALAITEINAFTQQELVPRTTDVIFKQSPLFVRLMNRRTIKVDGGTQIQRPIQYAKLNGGFFSRGDSFNTAFVQTDTAFLVNWKHAYVNITLYGTDDVLNRGRNAAFSQVESKFSNASMRMAEIIAKSMYQDGQQAVGATGTTGSDPYFSPATSMDGLLAWIDDGNTASSYDAATDLTKSFTSVGGITRTDLFATAPSFSTAKTPVSAVAGANSFVNRTMSSFALLDVQEGFGSAWYGNEYPDLIVCSMGGFNKFWNAIQSLQRYNDEQADVAKVGFRTFRFNGLTEVTVDKYMPNDGTRGFMLGLNTNYVELYITSNPRFQFGFTGFKDDQKTIDLAGQFLWAGNMVCPNPRTSFKIIGTSLL
jgi:hypothetical protein